VKLEVYGGPLDGELLDVEALAELPDPLVFNPWPAGRQMWRYRTAVRNGEVALVSEGPDGALG
jgi:hypothetical protein